MCKLYSSILITNVVLSANIMFNNIHNRVFSSRSCIDEFLNIRMINIDKCSSNKVKLFEAFKDLKNRRLVMCGLNSYWIFFINIYTYILVYVSVGVCYRGYLIYIFMYFKNVFLVTIVVLEEGMTLFLHLYIWMI